MNCVVFLSVQFINVCREVLVDTGQTQINRLLPAPQKQLSRETRFTI